MYFLDSNYLCSSDLVLDTYTCMVTWKDLPSNSKKQSSGKVNGPSTSTMKTTVSSVSTARWLAKSFQLSNQELLTNQVTHPRMINQASNQLDLNPPLLSKPSPAKEFLLAPLEAVLQAQLDHQSLI